MSGVPFGPMTICAIGKVEAQGHEEDQGRDLDGETPEHDVDAHLLSRADVGRRGDGPTDGLEQQRQEVRGDEQDAVGARFDPREALAVDDHDPGQTEVDGGADEGGRDGQGHNLPGDTYPSALLFQPWRRPSRIRRTVERCSAGRD